MLALKRKRNEEVDLFYEGKKILKLRVGRYWIFNDRAIVFLTPFVKYLSIDGLELRSKEEFLWPCGLIRSFELDGYRLGGIKYGGVQEGGLAFIFDMISEVKILRAELGEPQ